MFKWLFAKLRLREIFATKFKNQQLVDIELAEPQRVHVYINDNKLHVSIGNWCGSISPDDEDVFSLIDLTPYGTLKRIEKYKSDV